MPWTSEHLRWLVNTGMQLRTSDRRIIEIWEFRHENDETVLSAWAKHFRNHYCLDTEIDRLKPPKLSRSDYLRTVKFPDSSDAPGPSIRAGDFGQILVADYLHFILGYWVPRTQYCDKAIRNESSKGCDTVGFKLISTGDKSSDDILAIFEAKAQFSGSQARPRLQDAVDGSAKDELRKAESLNAIKQCLLDRQNKNDAETIERFQNPEDYPYREVYGAVALFSTQVFDSKDVSKTKTSSHPHRDKLSLLVIHGQDMMNLVHELYRRATDEA